MTPNTLFPGRPDYVGPTTGWFALLHHDTLFEGSHNVNERIAYVRSNKPENEVALRLHNMVYLGAVADVCAKCAPLDADYQAKCAALYTDYQAKRDALDADYRAKRDALDALDADYWAKRDALDADYRAKRDALYADYWAKRDALDAEVLAYVRSVVPDCAWNGTKLRGTDLA